MKVSGTGGSYEDAFDDTDNTTYTVSYTGSEVTQFDVSCETNAENGVRDIVTGLKGIHQVSGVDQDACDGKTRDYLWKMKCCKVITT